MRSFFPSACCAEWLAGVRLKHRNPSILLTINVPVRTLFHYPEETIFWAEMRLQDKAGRGCVEFSKIPLAKRLRVKPEYLYRRLNSLRHKGFIRGWSRKGTRYTLYYQGAAKLPDSRRAGWLVASQARINEWRKQTKQQVKTQAIWAGTTYLQEVAENRWFKRTRKAVRSYSKCCGGEPVKREPVPCVITAQHAWKAFRLNPSCLCREGTPETKFFRAPEGFFAGRRRVMRGSIDSKSFLKRAIGQGRLVTSQPLLVVLNKGHRLNLRSHEVIAAVSQTLIGEAMGLNREATCRWLKRVPHIQAYRYESTFVLKAKGVPQEFKDSLDPGYFIERQDSTNTASIVRRLPCLYLPYFDVAKPKSALAKRNK